MKIKTMISAAAIVMMGFSGTAMANEHEPGVPQGLAAGQGCQSVNYEGDTPGKLFKAAKNDIGGAFEGLNPKQAAEAAGNVPSGKVSEIIQLFCDNSPS